MATIEPTRFFLSGLFIVAGFWHLVRPDVFDPAIFWGHELLSNIAAGLFEFFLAALLWMHPRFGGRTAALWLAVLLPVHLYVSIRGIPMFGLSHPLILWGRTALQLPLIWLAWKLPLRRS